MFDGEEGTTIPKTEDTFFDREVMGQKGKTDITQPELVYFWTGKPHKAMGTYRDGFDIHGTHENASFAASGLSITEVPVTFQIASQALDTEIESRKRQAERRAERHESRIQSAENKAWLQERTEEWTAATVKKYMDRRKPMEKPGGSSLDGR